jgi:peptide/nickel transport system permease protein
LPTSLREYIIARLLITIPTVFVSLTAVFIVMHVIPGDPIRAMLGPKATEEMVSMMRHQLGLDRPLLTQYFDYLFNLLHGNLGNSITTRRPVTYEIALHFPITLQLTLGGIIIAAILGIYSGVISALKENKLADHAARIYAFFVYSLPVFWLGLMFQIIFGKMLGVLPIYGTLDPFIDRPPFITGMVVVDSLITGNLPAFFNSLEHMILPWLTIGLLLSATISRIARANMIEALGEDYVVGARAKGTPESVVTYKHALRNALLPVVTVIGLQFALLLGGALLTEYVYSLNGMGSLLISAIYDRDFPLTQGIVVVFSLLVALVSLSIDIVYAFLDPRIKY